MSESLEREILAELRIVSNCPQLTRNDLLEWSTSEERIKKNLKEGEVLITIPSLSLHCAVIGKKLKEVRGSYGNDQIRG